MRRHNRSLHRKSGRMESTAVRAECRRRRDKVGDEEEDDLHCGVRSRLCHERRRGLVRGPLPAPQNNRSRASPPPPTPRRPVQNASGEALSRKKSPAPFIFRRLRAANAIVNIARYRRHLGEHLHNPFFLAFTRPHVYFPLLR